MLLRASGGKDFMKTPVATSVANQRRRSRDTTRNGGLLVVVGATAPGDRVVGYVGNLLAGCDKVSVHLAYISSSLPASLLETGGSKNAEELQRIESNLRSQQRRWMRSADKKPEAILAAARETLVQAGIARSLVHTCLSSPLDAREPVEEVLILARDRQCETVVVAHHSHAWYSELVGAHLAEQLVRRAEGFAVWVID
jgi:nucleotide-binding universal stress UspA family protein